jgi:O-antigen/teichoic acid export membrane protein
LLNLERCAAAMQLPPEVVLLLLLIVTGSVAESIFTQIAIYQQTSARLVRAVAFKAVATLVASLCLLTMLPSERYLAVMRADAAVSLLFVAWVGAGLTGKARMTLSMAHLRFMLRYAVPLIPYMLCLTLLSQFDRVMIDRFFGKAETGLYSLAYNVGILMLMVVTAVLNVFNPAFYDGLARKDHARVLRDADSIFALAALVTLVLVLFGEQGFGLIVPAKYGPALDLIPLVALGGLCFVVFQLWARLIAYANRTWLLSLIALACLALKVGLNLWLLPRFGYKAAAATTVLAYLAMSVLCVLVVNHVLQLLTVRLLPSLGYIALCGAVVLLFALLPMGAAPAWALKLALLAAALWHFKARILGLLTLRDIARDKGKAATP